MVDGKNCVATKTQEGGVSQKNNVPANTSIRDLCDCGRHKNFPITPIGPTTRNPLDTDTNYNLAYKHNKNVRPRSSKRPLYDPSDFSTDPMIFDTNQRDDFKNLGKVDRVKPYIHSDNYEASSEPLQSKTSYRSEFTPKQVLPEIRRVDPQGETMGRAKGGKFPSETTTKEHYKQWKAQPALAFRDLPTFTGSILFPEKGQENPTTFQSSYLGTYHPPAEMAQTSKVINLKNEGAMYLGTTNKSTYKAYEGDHRAKRVNNKPSLDRYQRDKFIAETQNMLDFGESTNERPARAADPPPTTINENNYSTEQRSIYRGHDIGKHPVVKSCKKDVQEYEKPTEKITSITSQRNDYKPIDMSQIERFKVSRYTNDKLKVKSTKNMPFESSTTNKLFYKDWGTGERVRFGDYHDVHPYIPPCHPMEAETTTKGTYTAKKAERAEQHIPLPNLGKNEGNHSFDTEYNNAYKEQELHVCAAQRFILKKELDKKRVAQESNGSILGNIAPAQESNIAVKGSVATATEINAIAVN